MSFPFPVSVPVGPVGVVQTSATPVGAVTGGTLTMLDTGFALTNGRTVYRIGAYMNVAETCTVVICKRNSAGNYDVVVSQAFSHGGAGWQDVDLTNTYAIPNDGASYYAGFHSASAQPSNTSNRTYKSGAQSVAAGVTGWTEETSQATKAVRVTY